MQIECTCGYKSSCAGRDPHSMSVVNLRSSSYTKKVVEDFIHFNNVTDKEAVDHIIELWEIKRAYIKAINNPQEVDDLKISDERFAEVVGEVSKIEFLVQGQWCVPKTFADHAKALKTIKQIVNGKNNLCTINADFNLQKNKFLARPEGEEDEVLAILREFASKFASKVATSDEEALKVAVNDINDNDIKKFSEGTETSSAMDIKNAFEAYLHRPNSGPKLQPTIQKLTIMIRLFLYYDERAENTAQLLRELLEECVNDGYNRIYWSVVVTLIRDRAAFLEDCRAYGVTFVQGGLKG